MLTVERIPNPYGDDPRYRFTLAWWGLLPGRAHELELDLSFRKADANPVAGAVNRWLEQKSNPKEM